MSRTIWIPLVAVVVAGAAIGGYLWSQREVERIAEPLEAVHGDTGLLLEFRSLKSAVGPMAGVEYSTLLSSSAFIGPAMQRMMLLDSLFGGDELLAAMSGFHAISLDSALHIVTVMRPAEEQPSATLRGRMETYLAEGGHGRITVGDHLAYAFPQLGVTVLVTQGLVIVGSDDRDLARAVAVLASGKSVADDPQIGQARQSAGKNVQMNLYMRIPSRIFSDNSLWSGTHGWYALDLSTREEGPVLNGFVHTVSDSASPADAFRDQSPQTIGFQRAIPAQAVSFLMYGVSDVQKWHSVTSALSSETTASDTALHRHFLPWTGGQFGVCTMLSREGNAEQFAIVSSGSDDLALSMLHGLADGAGSDSAEVRAIPIAGLLRNVFGPKFPDSQETWFALHDGFVVFGPTKDAVNGYLHHLRADRTLATDVAFARFMEQFSSSFNVFSYHRLPLAGKGLTSHFSETGMPVLNDLAKLFGKLPTFGAQFTAAGGRFYTNMHWMYDPAWDTRPMAEAAARTAAEVTSRPIWVRNHLSGEMEVLVQDRDNVLYLFNSNGQELFRRELSEPIVGGAVQADRYRNGNLQYVFSTNNHIYQIDRNGKDVEGFPVELESPVAVPMAVVDYEGKRNYRMLLACKNGRVYNYGIDGKKVKGWKFDRTEKSAATSFAYLSDRRRDYLALAETDGRLHLLDRAGNRRSAVKETVVPSANTEVFPFGSKKGKHVGFYLTDNEGVVHHLQLNGKVSLINVGRFSAEHRFILSDLDMDGIPEFVFVDLNMMKVFDTDRKLLFEHRLAPGSIGPFLFNLDGKHQAIGIASPDDAHLLLFGADGRQVEGFPVSGSRAFDVTMGPGGQRMVVSGSSSGLTVQVVE